MISNLFIKFGEGVKYDDDGTVISLGKDTLIFCEESEKVFNLDVRSQKKGADLAFRAAVKSLLLQASEAPSSIPWERLEGYMQKYRMGYTLRMISHPSNTYIMMIH